MEDEEGEIFNNTYLTDLKAGRMSPTQFGRESSIPMSEINARNSLCPPHLRSSYAVQYDPDEEFRVRNCIPSASSSNSSSTTSPSVNNDVDVVIKVERKDSQNN